MTQRQFVLASLLCMIVFGGLYFAWTQRPEPYDGRHVLVFSKTTEYRHDSISAGIDAIRQLGREGEFHVETSEDASLFNDESLSGFQAVIFLNTTGDILNQEQQVAMERYIQAGGGFVGIHAAADTEWKRTPEGTYWPWYQRLVGGAFAGQPSSSDQVGELTVRDKNHLATRRLPESFQVSDEWYDFKRLSAGLHVLLTVDENSYEGAGMGKGADHPVAWYRNFDGGRSFYTALGHGETTYADKNFLHMVRGGISYAMGGGAPLDYSKSRPQAWRFSRRVLDSNLDEPLKLTFSPAGQLYYIERKGALQRFDFDKGASVTVHVFDDVKSSFEYGLLGLAFDPDFHINHWVYIYRTVVRGDAGEQVLARFKLQADVLDESSEQVLLTMPAEAKPDYETAHTGGDMQFDGSGNLWLSTGDDTKPADASNIDDRPGHIQFDAARSAGNTQDLRGKILRITPRVNADENGRYYDIPDGNLFADASQGLREIYVMGLRNPYTIAYDSRQQRLFWGEVGPDARAANDRGGVGYDEINNTDKPGNFGWPFVIADNQPYAYYDYEAGRALDKADVNAPENRSRNNTGMKVLPPAQPAWIAYPYNESDKLFELYSGGRNALVAPIYYSDTAASDSQIKFPSYYDGKLIISDFVRRWLLVVNTDDQGNPETIVPLIDQPLSAPLDMTFGPDGALYVVEYGSNWFSRNTDAYLSRIEFYSGDNAPPIAVASATKTIGAAPLTATLDASGSFDRDGSRSELVYVWQQVENGKPGAIIGLQELQPFTLAQAGEYYVQLTVTDAGGQATTAPLRFQVGNERPSVNIKINGNRSFYWDEQPLSYDIEVDDLEEGSTATGEISPADVTVKLGYVAGGEDLAKVLATESVDPLLSGRDLVTKSSDCHACHGVESASIGPAFFQIAQRYANTPGGDATIRQSIKAGVSGKWGSTHAMPLHSNLSNEQLDSITAYILSLADSESQAGVSSALSGALHGILQFDQHQEDYVNAKLEYGVDVDLGRFYQGVYILNSRYTDKGTDEAPALQGQDSLILRAPFIVAGAFDNVDGMMMLDTGSGVSIAIVSAPIGSSHFSYGLLKHIDLTGIGHIDVFASGISPLMPGGILELRIDSKDNKAIATQEITAPLIPNFEDAVVSLDVSQIDGVHDLYFGSPVDSDAGASGGIQYLLFSMKFVKQ